MTPIYERVFCGRCGGEGVARPEVAALQWIGETVCHVDRNVCEAELRRKKGKGKTVSQ